MTRKLGFFSIVAVVFIAAFLEIAGTIPEASEVNTPKRKFRMSGAMKALDFWAHQRAYPYATIPDDKYFAAFQRIESRLSKENSDSTRMWKSIGPHNIGGRTNAIAFNPQNPNTIYAGSASGGLWRSRTGGTGKLAWQYVRTEYPVLGVNTVAILPADSNTILIGTGEVYGYQNSTGGLSIRTTRGSYGIGILRTTDEGKTWSKSLDWSYQQRRGVQTIKIHPVHHRYVFATTTEGVYKSNDTGRTWMQVHSVVMATDIALHPTDTNIVFATCGNLGSAGGGIYRSTDAGTSWIKLAIGLPSSFGGKIGLAMYASSPNVIYASIGGGASSGSWLCRSTDNGNSWTTLTTQDYASYQGWYSHFVGVNPIDSSKILCGGVDLWKSTTGGTNLVVKSDWAAWYFGTTIPGEPEGPPNYSHADHHTIAYHPANPDIIYFGNDGGIFRTTDGGETFQGCNGGYQTTQFYNGFSSATTDSMIAIGGLQDNATAIYEGTVAWRRVIGGDGCMTAINSQSADTIYGSSQNLNILKSVDRGHGWTTISPPSGGTTNFVGPFILAPSNPRIMYAGRSKVFRSQYGGGGVWTAMNNNTTLDDNPILMFAVSYTNSDTVYVTTTPRSQRAHVFRSTNGGTSWTNITGSLPDRYLVDIVVDPNNSAVVYVTASGFGTSHLFTSTDAGLSWSDIGSGLPDVPTSAVIVDPSYANHLYVGNDLGVFFSANGGASWQQLVNGLPDAAIIMDLSISPTNRVIRAVTHGNGVYEQKLIAPIVGVHQDDHHLATFELHQNYPNPFNPSTTFRITIPHSGRTVLKIYNIEGKEISTIMDREQGIGSFEVTWSAQGIPSGVYFARLSSGSLTTVRKIVLLR